MLKSKYKTIAHTKENESMPCRATDKLGKFKLSIDIQLKKPKNN